MCGGSDRAERLVSANDQRAKIAIAEGLSRFLNPTALLQQESEPHGLLRRDWHEGFCKVLKTCRPGAPVMRPSAQITVFD